RERRLGQGQAHRHGDAVELVTEPGLVPAGHQTGAGRTAIWTGDIALREADTLFRDRIDVGRWDVLPTLEAVLTPADVVAEDDQDVRLPPFRCVRECRAEEQKRRSKRKQRA